MSVLPVQYYSESPEFTLPIQAYEDAAGYGFYAAETITILPHSCQSVSIEMQIAIPQGYFGKIFSRSGLTKHHLITAEASLIDSDYRGFIMVILINHGTSTYTVTAGEKIAQIVFMKKQKVKFIKVDDVYKLGKTKRGSSGFGSTSAKKVKFDDSENFDEEKEEEKIAKALNKENEVAVVVEHASLTVNGEKVIEETSYH